MSTFSGDLVIDDDIEGETVVGEGKDGIFSKPEEEVQYPMGMLPKKQNKVMSNMRGMSGPVSSSILVRFENLCCKE